MTGTMLIFGTYALALLFLVTFILKARKIAGLPSHLRWELSPVPGEKGKSHYGGSYLEEYEWWTKPREKSLIDEAIYMFKEIFFLKGVYEHNKNLWYFSFPFHFGLYLLTFMVLLMFVNSILIQTGIIQAGSLIENILYGFAIVGFIIGGIGNIGLIFRRLGDRNLANYSSGGTVFNLFFLLALFATGALAVFSVPDFAESMTVLAGALLGADTSVQLPALITLNWTVSLLFLAYLPFTKMLHFLAKYFTYHEVRWNDSPMKGDGRTEADVKKLLGQKVTWSAPHLKADGKKNWIDIVSEEDEK